MLGYAASATTIASVMQGCKADATPGWQPDFLSADQAQTLGDLAECILPTTETSPGAKEVGIVAFFDQMLKDVSTEDEKQYFLGELKKFEDDCKATHGKTFSKLAAAEQTAMVQKYADAAQTASGDDDPFFTLVQEATVFGYFTSEKIGREYLKYDPIPGEYLGCIPYDEVGGVWSL